MLGSSRYTRVILAQGGEIEQRLQVLEKSLENVGTRASANARDTAENLGDAIASALSGWADRFRQGASTGRPISCAQQGCGKAWNRGPEPDHRRNRAASAICACGRGRCGDSRWYGHAQFADGLVKVSGESAMDENRVEGTVKKAAGKVGQGVGRLTGDAEIQAKGIANEISGSAQDLYGQVHDSASELVRSTGDAVGKFIKRAALHRRADCIRHWLAPGQNA